MLVLPGFVDLHTHLRTPGREDEEDVASGTLAAAAGGYVRVFAMANTDPVIDNAGLLRGLAGLARRGGRRAGRLLRRRDARPRRASSSPRWPSSPRPARSPSATTAGRWPSANLVRRALQYAKVTGRFVAIHAQDDSLFKGGQMHEGPTSARIGLGGIPSLSESLDVARAARDRRLRGRARCTCATSARRRPSSTSGAPRRPAQGDLRGHAAPPDAHRRGRRLPRRNLKMNPPLREEDDRQALVKALKSGLVDCVATDHAPHAPMSKDVPFEEAAFGTIGLETAFAVLHTELVKKRALDLGTLVTQDEPGAGGDRRPRAAGDPPRRPRRPLRRRPAGDLDGRRTRRCARSRVNSAFLGRQLSGRVRLTLAAGRLAWEADA